MSHLDTAQPVPEQLSTALLPVVRQGDGSYQVNIKLQPEELGTVHVEMHLEAGTVNVTVHADGDATRDMLRQNLPHLRQQLQDSGLSTGNFDVGTGTSDSQEMSQGPGTGAQDREPQDYLGSENVLAATAQDGSGAPGSTTENGQLDMRL